jgi:hypothetical protein
MAMAEHHVVTNEAVLKALGITQTRVLSADIKLRVNEAPLVVLRVLAGESIDEVDTKQFRLVMIDAVGSDAQQGTPDGQN